MDARTEKTRQLWEHRANRYDTGARWEPAAIRESRRLLCAGARGRTLEVAVGTGMNLQYYPPQVELTGVDLSPAMLTKAEQKVREQGRSTTLVEGDAQDLSYTDHSFDTVVCLFALCTVPDQVRALEEMYRVLVQGGRLLMADHIEYTRFPNRVFERRRDHPRRLPRKIAEEVGCRIGHTTVRCSGSSNVWWRTAPEGMSLFHGRMDGSPSWRCGTGLSVFRARSRWAIRLGFARDRLDTISDPCASGRV